MVAPEMMIAYAAAAQLIAAKISPVQARLAQVNPAQISPPIPARAEHASLGLQPGTGAPPA